MDFKDWILVKRKPIRGETAAVVGAGPSLNKAKTWDEIARHPYIVGVNWVFKIITVDFLVITHIKLLIDIQRGEVEIPSRTTLVYSEYASDFLFQGPRNPQIPDAVVFREYQDLLCGASTIIPAIDLAGMLADTVYLYGVDLKKTDGVQYVDGYETKKTQDADTFDVWARLVGRQIDGWQRMTGKTIIRVM